VTIVFDLSELRAFKREHPDWVILFGDKSKNPARLVGSWKDLTSQTPQELEELIVKAQVSEVEAWNFGPRTGLGNLACLDWDWEFLAYRWIKHFGERAKTLTFRTPNLSFRMLFLTFDRENCSPFKRFLHMEFENGGYVAVGGYAEDAEGKKQPYVKALDVPIRSDCSIIGDTKAFLALQLEKYDFLRYNCVGSVVDKKHIRLDHVQRLAVVQFMLAKDFADEEIHDFFRAVYDSGGKRDYDGSLTQAQIESARSFRERGGKPSPCTAKTDPETGHVSTPLFQVFGSDQKNCGGCTRKIGGKLKSNGPKELKTEDVLSWIKEQFVFKTPTDLRDLFYFDEGIYKPAQCKVEALIEKQLGSKANTGFVDEIIEHLKRDSYVDRCEFNRYAGFVPVHNGLLELKTLELRGFDAEVIFTYKLNFKYDAGAVCPKWFCFLDQILPKEDQLLLQEYLGYCVLPSMPKHKMMWFYGSGRNGKGRVIATVEYILGKENCSYLELNEFDGEHRFALAQLYGKLVNVSSEPSTKRELQTPLLKKITGEDYLDAEVKGKQTRLKFRSVAKPFVLGNQFPKIKDCTLAFEDRTLILKFPYSFTGKNQVDNIEKQWIEDSAELSGIFNWMLDGLHRLGLNGEFTLSKTTKEVALELKRTSDSVGAWVSERCVFHVEGYVSRKNAFEDYKGYCDQDLGVAPDTEKFFQRLRDLPKIAECKTREARGFRGIRLKAIEEQNGGVAVQEGTLADYGARCDAGADGAPSTNQ
jgi:P4 family phage/plasmid primase-like protien